MIKIKIHKALDDFKQEFHVFFLDFNIVNVA